jgi:HAD superfamily hydrolase (TIGR01509 family)
MADLDLIIFDCDGVLVDSERLACNAVSVSLSEVGIDLPTDAVIRDYIGISTAAMMADLASRFPEKVPPDFLEIVQVRTLEAFDKHLKAMDGAKELLSTIQLPVCVASSSTLERISHSLQLTGLLEFFVGSIFSASQVAHGKPFPDLFLFAAEQMSTLAQACLVIEDSIPGVQAGCAAGMRVLGFTGGNHCEPGHAQKLKEQGAIATIGRMEKLPPFLEILGGKAQVAN